MCRPFTKWIYFCNVYSLKSYFFEFFGEDFRIFLPMWLRLHCSNFALLHASICLHSRIGSLDLLNFALKWPKTGNSKFSSWELYFFHNIFTSLLKLSIAVFMPSYTYVLLPISAFHFWPLSPILGKNGYDKKIQNNVLKIFDIVVI